MKKPPRFSMVLFVLPAQAGTGSFRMAIFLMVPPLSMFYPQRFRVRLEGLQSAEANCEEFVAGYLTAPASGINYMRKPE